MELKKDETVVSVENDKMVITRTLSEVFDAEEYLRRLTQIENQRNAVESSMKEIEKMIERLTPGKELAQKIRAKEIEEAKIEREKASTPKDEN